MNKITLSKPPSVNRLYKPRFVKGKLGIIMDKIGKDWTEIAGWEIKRHQMYGKSQNQPAIKKDVAVNIILYTCQKQDLDNVAKIVLDLLQKQSVIENDEQVMELHMHKVRVQDKKYEKLELEWNLYKKN